MKIYIVECDNADYMNMFLVKADTKKEALETIWNEWFIPENEEAVRKGYDPFYKKELHCMTLEEYFDDKENKIAILN